VCVCVCVCVHVTYLFNGCFIETAIKISAIKITFTCICTLGYLNWAIVGS